MIKTGLYRHFKGGFYRVVGTARHTETDEVLVIYYDISNDKEAFVRPLPMFIETVEQNGKKIPRFQFCY